jgi:Insertion element 4 transposase N-terminal/Transposase DDE domain
MSGCDRTREAFSADLSVLARLVPSSLVRRVLAEAGVVSRTRRTSAVLGVYLVLAMTLFPQVGLPRVFAKLTGVDGRGGGEVPSASSLRKRRAGLGVEVFRLLFERLAGTGPVAERYAGLLVCAWDGTTVSVPDTADNAVLGRKANAQAAGPFPLARLLVLVSCGSRALIGAVVDGVRTAESKLAGELVGLLDAGMLLLADRAFGGFQLWCRAADTEAQLLWRVTRSIPVRIEQVLPDGSGIGWWPASGDVSRRRRAELGLPDRVRVRILTGWITVIDAAGVRRSESYRLLTTLTDHQAHPAGELLRLYGRRWQVEVAIKGLKCGQQLGMLRSKTLTGVFQEVWAALCVQQLLRLEAAAAAQDTEAQIARIGFAALVDRIRDAVVRTAGRRGAVAELARMRRAVRRDLTEVQIRIRCYDRVVKRRTSKFATKHDHHGGAVIHLQYVIDALPPMAVGADQQQPAKINS